MAENDAEIVATCETAVTWLTDGERGWTQESYTETDSEVRYEGTVYGEPTTVAVDYSATAACLGGALVLAGLDSPVQSETVASGHKLAQCPALPAVAAVIREKYPDPLEPVPQPVITRVDPTYYDRQTIFSFNDHDDRKVDDVIDVLNETIKRHTSEVISVTGDGSPDGADGTGAPGA